MRVEMTQFETGKHHENISRQFSLSMLLMIVTGIGCYLGGRIQGYRQGIAIWDSAPNYPISYRIDDVLLVPKLGKTEILTLDAFTLQLKNDVMPGVWMESGGKASARPFHEKSSLVVTANQLVHEAVSKYLRKARASKSP